MWRAVLVVACIACGGGKAKTPAELKQEYGAKLEARLDKLVAAGVAGKAALDQLGAPGDHKLVLDFELMADKHHPNAIAVLAKHLDSAKTPAPKTELTLLDPLGGYAFSEDGRNHVYLAKSLLGIEKTETYYPEYMFRQLLDDVKYLLVVHPQQYVPPSGGGGELSPGRTTAKAVLVEIETAKPLGGFVVSSSSSDEIVVTVRKRDGSSNEDEKIVHDLYAQTGKAIANAIEARWPGAAVPWNWGFGY